MNDYLEIFSDVVLLATFQPRRLAGAASAPRTGEPTRRRPVPTTGRRGFDGPARG